MTDAERHQLLGTYATPAVQVGSRVVCAVRGPLVVLGLRAATIPWPVGRPARGRGRSLVVFGGLAKAVRRESSAAVAHWREVSDKTVWAWRQALGVGRVTAGTTRLRSAALRASPAAAAHQRAREAARARRQDGELARVLSAEARRKMSEAKAGRPGAPKRAWTPAEDALLGVLPDAEVARRTGRSRASVKSRRRTLGRDPAAP